MTRYYSAIAVDNTVGTAITNASTTLVLTSSPVGYPTNYPFVLALDYGAAQEELVQVTNISGTTLTITRGFNGTTAQAHAVGAVVRHVISAQDLTDTQIHYAATSGVHGVTGSVVGTTDTQTLTNKTLTSPAISGPVITGTVTAGGTTGSAGQVLTSSGSGVGWSTPAAQSVAITQQSSSYTLLSTDAFSLVQFTNTSAATVTVPPSVFTQGQYIYVQGISTGSVAIAAGSGVTITSTGATAAAPNLRAQYSSAAIICTGTNTFTVLGDIA